MEVAAYDASGHGRAVDLAEAVALAAEPAAGPGRGFVRVMLDDPSPDELERVRQAFAVPDATAGHHRRRGRPSLAVVDGHLLVTVGTAAYDDEGETVVLGDITVWTGAAFVVVVRRGVASAIAHGPDEVSERPELLRHGPFGVVLDVVDDVVDAYQPVAVGVDEDIGEVEDDVFSSQRTNAAERIYRLQREVGGFRRVMIAHAAALERLLERDLVPAELHPRFVAVRDHVDRLVDRATGQRDALATALDAHLAQLSVQQNDDMRRISAWVAIAAVPTAVAGIYGMNFAHMPELGWRYGYAGVLVVIAVACLVLYRLFRRSGWL